MGKPETDTNADEAAAESAPVLLALTPEYDPKQHGLYFAAIQTALTGPNNKLVKNIALTGSYGVGKSSILQQVVKKHPGTIVSISLSTLGFADEPSPTGAVAKAATSKTNRIQKEIVKQLLYSQDPVRMPGSRYRRVTRFRFWREVGLAALISIPATIAFFLAGWSASLAKLSRLPPGLEDLVNVGIFVAILFFVLGVRKVLHNRIHIERVSAGAATISLSTASETFFDEYLDEIVYFFEMTNVEVVVFEDIDRFDEPHIFETLRSLNALVNGAKQLRERNIRFIYAIKDSIFDELGARAAAEEGELDEETTAKQPSEDAADAEIARANRTKFFDLVIPVVPFVTHRSARDVLKTTLFDVEGHSVSDALIDLAARHVADMRLIKNIRNEFAIFRQRIIVEGSLDLNDDALLAMILYKSTHLSDFEKIKSGQSDLDALYSDSREFVNTAIAERGVTLRALRKERSSILPSSSRFEQLADALEQYVERMLRHYENPPPSAVWRLNGEAINNSRRRSQEFWDEIATGGASLTVTFPMTVPGWGNRFEKQLTITREDLAEQLGDPLESQRWRSARLKVIEDSIAGAVKEQDFLRHATVGELAGRSTITVSGTDYNSKLEARLKSELARQLVRNDYIDGNFTLYTSTFYAERVSTEATNFLIKNVDRNKSDLNYPLTADDVEALFRERGPAVLGEQSMYNISILDHLLSISGDSRARELIKRLASYGSVEKAFLFAYLGDGARAVELVHALAEFWSKTFELVAVDSPLDDERRALLTDAALNSINANVDYEVSEDFKNYLESHYLDLQIFTSDETRAEQADLLSSLMNSLDARVDSLDELGAEPKRSIVNSGTYTVTRTNLVTALGRGATGLALDDIRASSDPVYQRVLTELPVYLAALDEDEATVASSEEFGAVIKDVLASDELNLNLVVERAAASVTLRHISDVPSSAWKALARASRFPTTFANIEAYIEEFGIDLDLGRLLIEAKRITAVEAADETRKANLAVQVITAQTFISSAKARAELAASLKLKKHIPAGSIPQEAGELLGRLIAEEVINDTAEAFGRLAVGDWGGLEYAVSQSTEFAMFMSPTEVPVEIVGAFVTSRLVPDAAKDVIISRLAEFTVGASLNALRQIADWAIANRRRLLVQDVHRLASEGIGSERVIKLLEPLLTEVTLEELSTILGTLKDDYGKLAGRTGKRPRLSATPALRALVARLNQLGVVGKIDDKKGFLTVNMKFP